MSDVRLRIQQLRVELPALGIELLSISDVLLPPRGKTVLLGNSGSGKTMLLRGILGYLPPYANVVGRITDVDTGRAFLDSDLQNGVFPSTISCGYLPQSGTIFPHHLPVGRVLEPLRAQALVKDLDRWLWRFGLGSTADVAPRYPSSFSGGEQRRLALAVILSKAPEIIFLDEPTSGLDDRRVEEFSTMLQELEHTMIIASHDLLFAREIADHVIFLDSGRVAEVGAMEEIYNNAQTPQVQEYCASWRSLISKDRSGASHDHQHS